LCMALMLLSGCESIFGKQSGARGALPGKREDVFSAERALKPDAALKGAALDVPAATEQAEWPFAGGTLTRAHGNLALSAQPASAWAVSIGEGSGDKGAFTAPPVVGGGKVFTIDANAHITALSADNGAVVWQKDIPDPRPEDAEIAGAGLAFAGGKLVATTSYGNVAVLDAGSGNLLWQKQLPSPIRSAPVVDGDRIYVTTTTNNAYDISLQDGTLGWNHQGVEETAALMGMAAPMPLGEIVIVPYSSGQVTALRKLNGGTVWEENLASITPTEGTLPAMSDIQGEMVLDNNRLYVASHSGRLVVLDARSGQRLLETDAGGTSMPWVAGSTVFVLTIENQIAALSTEDGRVRWSVDLPRYTDPEDRTDPIVWTGPVLAGGTLYLANSLGELHGYDPHTGRETALIGVGAPVFIPPIVAARTLYILSDDGTLTAYR
ncbi:MAG TPA: PQQ-binding-like beta-propeller repeat protein, partial [Alphaproteobacteria bacterium]|nr:PQQ-binding-like beta-propeller repeat protein [Alphaproteobacteria bacterium]